jgi:hypothetical protein
MLVNHERRLLTKAAQSTDGCVSVKRQLDRAWPGDHSRLCNLESRGELVWLGGAGRPSSRWHLLEVADHSGRPGEARRV